MAVATAALDARPSVRMVLLKAHDARGFVFYTHIDGRKGRELQANPQAALLFHWPRVRNGVQVRIEGDVRVVSDAEADAYFASRPRGSQIGAWASKQSETLDPPSRRSRHASRRPSANSKAATCRARRAGPGFRVRPRRIEFWYGAQYRLHERHVYEQRRRRRLEHADAVSVTALRGPRRIVCLTEEPTETLYALGEHDRIVGISGFTVRPREGAQGKTEGQRLHQREDRRDPRTRAGSSRSASPTSRPTSPPN